MDIKFNIDILENKLIDLKHTATNDDIPINNAIENAIHALKAWNELATDIEYLKYKSNPTPEDWRIYGILCYAWNKYYIGE